MRDNTLTVLGGTTLGALALCLSVPAAASTPDAEAVKTVVVSAYVEGVHAKGDADAMRKGFHPSFRMDMLRDGKLESVTLDEWITRLEKGWKEGARPQVRHEFTHVEVAGSAAAVRLELHRDGRHTFSDFLSLYRFPDGWKIVAKTFYAWPKQ
jgi:hypothetical protein